jgi:hypothetical protein
MTLLFFVLKLKKIMAQEFSSRETDAEGIGIMRRESSISSIIGFNPATILETCKLSLLTFTRTDIILYGSSVSLVVAYTLLVSVSLELPFVVNAFVYCSTEFSLIVLIINLGLLAFVIFNIKRVQIVQIVYVVYGEVSDPDTTMETVLAFFLAVTVLPLWLLTRDYTIHCLLHRTCVMPAEVFRVLNDVVCGPVDPTSAESLSICHAFMICLPTTILTLTPGVLAAGLYTYCRKHPTECCPRIVPDPPPIYTFPQKSTN